MVAQKRGHTRRLESSHLQQIYRLLSMKPNLTAILVGVDSEHGQDLSYFTKAKVSDKTLTKVLMLHLKFKGC